MSMLLAGGRGGDLAPWASQGTQARRSAASKGAALRAPASVRARAAVVRPPSARRLSSAGAGRRSQRPRRGAPAAACQACTPRPAAPLTGAAHREWRLQAAAPGPQPGAQPPSSATRRPPPPAYGVPCCRGVTGDTLAPCEPLASSCARQLVWQALRGRRGFSGSGERACGPRGARARARAPACARGGACGGHNPRRARVTAPPLDRFAGLSVAHCRTPRVSHSQTRWTALQPGVPSDFRTVATRQELVWISNSRNACTQASRAGFAAGPAAGGRQRHRGGIAGAHLGVHRG